MTLHAGETFAGYTIVRQIGSGGMGEVYLAQHPRLPRQDALKILRPDISTDHDFRRRFIRKADSIAALPHPNIVTVHDRGEFHGQLWIATQYINGLDAAQLLRHHHPTGVPITDATTIVTAIAAALDHAHHHGLIHRDIKPANILLTHPDYTGTRHTYLADFGIAHPLFPDDSVPDELIGYRGPSAWQIAGITYRQLDIWARTSLVVPSIRGAAGSGSQRLYSFRDILVLKIVKSLLDTGISMRNIRVAVDHLRKHGVQDLANITLLWDGTGVYECTSAEEVVDLLQGGQGMFGIAVSGAMHELTRDIADFEHPNGWTATNFTLGTIAYAAPEQLLGKATDGRADQYALAATTHHLLTGTTLFPVTNPVAAISQHLTETPPKLSTRRPELAPLDAALTRALSKKPDHRYPDCTTFANALTAATTM